MAIVQKVVGGKHCQFKGEAVMLFEVSSTEGFYEARKWKSLLVSKVGAPFASRDILNPVNDVAHLAD